MTAKKKPHTEPVPVLLETFIETLITNLGNESTNHQKNHNSESSDIGESEKATESERNPNSNPDDDSESESEPESADAYESAADEPAAEKPAADAEPSGPPSARRKERAKAAVENIQNQSIFTGLTTVVLIGNPGVGKSTLLNILGGNFESGFSLVGGLTDKVTKVDVELQGRRLRLVDMPGINETNSKTTEANLKHVQEQLSNGSSYVLFFVVSPRNGRIEANDLGLISFVLKNLKSGPTVGLIFTQIPNDQIMLVQDPEYASAVVQVLKDGKAKTALLEQKNVLALPYLGSFNDEEKQKVIDYVLSFEPKQVKIRRLALDTFEKFKTFFKKMFEGKSTLKKKENVPTERRGPQAI